MANKYILLLPELRKFIRASASGRRLMPSGKKIRRGTLIQYEVMYRLLQEFEQTAGVAIRLFRKSRFTARDWQKERLYWKRLFNQFTGFLYREKSGYDQYVASVAKVLRTFLRYLEQERGFPALGFYRKLRVPAEVLTPIVLSPEQLKFLINDKRFIESLSPHLQRTRDLFVFACMVGLRYRDLMSLRTSNLQYTEEGVNLLLHTQKTGAMIRVPLPDWAVELIRKYRGKAGTYLLPRISGTNLNLQIKTLMERAGWVYSLPKIRNRRGEPVELKKPGGKSWRFCDHITVHTCRRTAITTLLLLGVEENMVRRISGHAPGSREFYKYVGLVQDYLDRQVKEAHRRLVE